jgi:hypothetical protein
MSFFAAASRWSLPAIIFTALALLLPASADAQTAPTPPPLSAEEVDQAQLESFVAAATQVNEISEQLQLRAQGIEDEGELAVLQEEATSEMVAAVEAAGLTVEEYNAIFQLAQADPAVNATVVEMLQQQR